MKLYSCLLLLLALVAGCGKSPVTDRCDAIFAGWLMTEHGESNVIFESNGVGVAGNKTRFHASLSESTKHDTGCEVVIEFRIRLPEGGSIIEYEAGSGTTEEKAVNRALTEFIGITMPVVYKAFINPGDPQQRVKSITINGQARQMFASPCVRMAAKGMDPFDLDSISAQFQDIAAALPLGPGPHWITLICSQHPNKPIIVSATLDNDDSAQATAALNKMSWPQRDQFYMVKQFIVIK